MGEPATSSAWQSLVTFLGGGALVAAIKAARDAFVASRRNAERLASIEANDGRHEREDTSAHLHAERRRSDQLMAKLESSLRQLATTEALLAAATARLEAATDALEQANERINELTQRLEQHEAKGTP